MPKVLVQTDDGVTVQTLEFGMATGYALAYMPSCPTNMALHGFLMRLKGALSDAMAIQEGNDPRRLSERVMDRLAQQRYRVVRRFMDGRPDEVRATGLTFNQARQRIKTTNGQTGWYDIYEVEEAISE